GRIPYPRRLVLIAMPSDEPLAVAGKGDGMDRRPDPRAAERVAFFDWFPDLGRPIVAAGDHPLAVWRNRRGPDRTQMAPQRADFLAGRSIPDFSGAIAATGENPLLRKGYRIDPMAVPFQGKQFPAAGNVPHFAFSIPSAGNNPPPIRGESHAVY